MGREQQCSPKHRSPLFRKADTAVCALQAYCCRRSNQRSVLRFIGESPLHDRVCCVALNAWRERNPVRNTFASVQNSQRIEFVDTSTWYEIRRNWRLCRDLRIKILIPRFTQVRPSEPGVAGSSPAGCARFARACCKLPFNTPRMTLSSSCLGKMPLWPRYFIDFSRFSA
jgi:hypothetical protein